MTKQIHEDFGKKIGSAVSASAGRAAVNGVDYLMGFGEMSPTSVFFGTGRAVVP
jgi:hypothetical protein